MKKELNLKGRDVLKIKALPGELDYDKESKMKGKKYRRFAYDNAVFVANTEDAFCKQFDEDKLYSVDLLWEQDGDKAQLSLMNNTSIDREINMARAEATLTSIMHNVKAEAIDEALLDALS
jgi:hypothetical protein